MDGRRSHPEYSYKVYGALHGDNWLDRITLRTREVEINLPRMKAYKPYKILSTRLKIRKDTTYCIYLNNMDLMLLKFEKSRGLNVEKIYFFLEEIE
jgi:hypothetical protein